MKVKIVLFAAYLLTQPFSEVHAGEHKLYEIPRTQVVPIQDTETGRPYELYVKLPEKYSEKNDVKYPVIYFTDAVWHIEILSASTEYLMEDVILVGISWQTDLEIDGRVHASRFRDYSVQKLNNPEHQKKYQFGQAEHHLAFIRNHVIRYIETHYRTDPDFRTYFGYSLGGEFGSYILLSQPDTFKNYILGSPSLKGNISYLSKLRSRESLKDSVHANVFISYGTLEKELGQHAEKLITLLKKNDDAHLSLKQVVIEGTHQTAFPLTGVHSVSWLSNMQKERNK